MTADNPNQIHPPERTQALEAFRDSASRSMIYEVHQHASTEMAKKRGTNGEKGAYHVSFDHDIYKKSHEQGKDHSSRPNDATDARDGSQYERRQDGNGGIKTHSGDKTEQNYIKTDDGKGTILVYGKDGTGYARTEQPGGAYNEGHFGPNPSDNYMKSGDGKGNDVESRKDADGNSIEKYSFQKNPNNNFTWEHHTDNSQTITDAKGNKTSIASA